LQDAFDFVIILRFGEDFVEKGVSKLSFGGMGEHLPRVRWVLSAAQGPGCEGPSGLIPSDVIDPELGSGKLCYTFEVSRIHSADVLNDGGEADEI
jgi:hypothetical protein